MVRSLALASAAATLIALSAQASTLSGDFSGVISTPSDHSAATFVYAGGGTNSFSWGTPSGPDDSIEPGNTSVLSVDNGAFSHSVSGAGDYLFGTISWINQSNWHAGGVWASVMTLSLTFDTPDGPLARSVPLGFSVYNSTDVSVDTDLNEQTGRNPDEITGFVLDTGAFDVPLALGNGKWLTDVFFQLDEAGTPGTDGSDASGREFAAIDFGSTYDPLTGLWKTREGGMAEIGVYGSVSTIPLPAGLWLLLSGLGGVALLGRRRARAA